MYKWKYEKNPANGINIAELLHSWIIAKNAGKQNKEISWTTQEEEKLVRLEWEDINIIDTELGRQVTKTVNEALSVPPHLTDVQVQEIKAALPDNSPMRLWSKQVSSNILTYRTHWVSSKPPFEQRNNW